MMNKKNEKLFWLEKFNAICLKGSDIKRFLNGITTSNMNSKDEFVQTCWLNPKGYLQALLEIHFNEKTLTIVVLQGDIDQIQKFLEDMIFPSDDVITSDYFSIFRIQEIQYDISWRKFNPTILLEENLKDYLDQNLIKLIDSQKLKGWKMIQAIPQLNFEINRYNNPLELGLYDLIDFSKGCYVGQEIMARLKKISSLKNEIRVWYSEKQSNNIQIKDPKIYTTKEKEQVAGYISSIFLSDSNQAKGLAMIKKSFLQHYKSLFSEDIGTLRIEKSIGSVFF